MLKKALAPKLFLLNQHIFLTSSINNTKKKNKFFVHATNIHQPCLFKQTTRNNDQIQIKKKYKQVNKNKLFIIITF